MTITIETDLKEVLGEIKQQLNAIQEDITDLKIDVATVKTTISSLEGTAHSLENKLEKIETEQKNLIKDIADLKGAKSLIIPIIVAVTTSLITLLIRAIPNP